MPSLALSPLATTAALPNVLQSSLGVDNIPINFSSTPGSLFLLSFALRSVVFIDSFGELRLNSRFCSGEVPPSQGMRWYCTESPYGSQCSITSFYNSHALVMLKTTGMLATVPLRQDRKIAPEFCKVFRFNRSGFSGCAEHQIPWHVSVYATHAIKNKFTCAQQAGPFFQGARISTNGRKREFRFRVPTKRQLHNSACPHLQFPVCPEVRRSYPLNWSNVRIRCAAA